MAQWHQVELTSTGLLLCDLGHGSGAWRKLAVILLGYHLDITWISPGYLNTKWWILVEFLGNDVEFLGWWFIFLGKFLGQCHIHEFLRRNRLRSHRSPRLPDTWGDGQRRRLFVQQNPGPLQCREPSPGWMSPRERSWLKPSKGAIVILLIHMLTLLYRLLIVNYY